MQRALLHRNFVPKFSFYRQYMYRRGFIEFLRNLPQPEHTQLENGANVVTLQQEGCRVCVAIFADAGSRYELEFENGISHLFEHIVFKSNKCNSRSELESRINALGIKLYALTTRELVGYYAYCLPDHTNDAVAILSECVVNNAFSTNDICTEKHIIYEEIIKHDTDPKTLVFDYLHSTAFQGTGLAQTVMGTSKNLHNLDPGLIKQYWERVLHPCRLCLCVVGSVSHSHIVEKASQYFSWYKPLACSDNVYRYTGSEVRYRNDTLPRAHVAYAMEGPPFSDVDTFILDLVAIMIGGWDRSQMGDQNHSVSVARRASLGNFCDAYKSFFIKYKDTSLWGAQFVSASLQLEDMLYTLQDTLLDMCTTTSEGELERAKEEWKSKLLYDTATSYGAAKDLAKHVLFNCCHLPTIYHRCDYIDKISVENFKETLYGYMYNKCPVVAAVGATEGLPEYNRIRAGQYWLRL